MVLAFICAVPLMAQLEDAGPLTKAKCEEYLKTPLPPEALSVAVPKQWPDCESYKSYSGIGRKADYGVALQCAWSERLAIQANLEPKNNEDGAFGGPAMLAVLYANGEGVARNIPLAIRFACEAGGAPMEIQIRIEHLESLSSTAPANGSSFDFCDDITSGFMEGFCAAYGSEIEDQKRAISFKALVSHFTPAQRPAFDALRKSEEDYALAHARGEIDLSGTARAMYQIDAEQSLRDDFLAALLSFQEGNLPKSTADAAREADLRLNSAYRKVMQDAEAHKSDYGAVQPEGIRNAERAWLSYRDAWLAFAKLRYPVVPAESWLALLTTDRTSILDGTFCDMDAVDKPCAQEGDTWKPSPLP